MAQCWFLLGMYCFLFYARRESYTDKSLSEAEHKDWGEENKRDNNRCQGNYDSQAGTILAITEIPTK